MFSILSNIAVESDVIKKRMPVRIPILSVNDIGLSPLADVTSEKYRKASASVLYINISLKNTRKEFSTKGKIILNITNRINAKINFSSLLFLLPSIIFVK